jgi:hypothetical protein
MSRAIAAADKEKEDFPQTVKRHMLRLEFPIPADRILINDDCSKCLTCSMAMRAKADCADHVSTPSMVKG